MVFMQRQRVNDLLLRARVVVKTSNVKISRRLVVWQTTSKHCAKKRAARAARLFFFIQPIKEREREIHRAKDQRLYAQVVISRYCFAEDGTDLFIRACRSCSTIIFHTRPIKLLIYDVVVAVPVVDTKIPYRWVYYKYER